MNIAPLFKNFDELADAPERIPALRKVILAYLLHSAVNSPDAASRAATLRTAHETRRGELIRRAARKEVPTVPEVADDDLPPSLSDIPTVLFDRLGNIASIEKGLSQIQSTTPGKYPLVVTAETRSSSESFDFEGAAAIIPLVSSTGHGDASLKRLHYQEGRYAVGNILAVVKPICPDLLRARFIYEYLSAFKEELLVSRMVGTANVSLTVNKLKEVPVPLVSGPVLCRIDELMALCDRLEAQQQERETRHAALARASLARFADAPTPANLPFLFHPSYAIPPADLRKSILTLAVQGKLVPQDPNDEPAGELLEKVRKARRTLAESGDVKTKVQLAPIGPDQEPYSIPDTWLWVPLNEVTELVYGKLLPTTELLPEGFQVFGANGIIGRFSKYLYEDEMLLISCRGAYSGTPNISPPKCYVTNNSIVCEFFDSKACDIRFFHAVISISPREKIVTGSAQPQVTVANAIKLPVPLPPLAEQRRIVAKVEQLMALVDALETQLAASRATAANLLSAVVAELTACRHAGASTLS